MCTMKIKQSDLCPRNMELRIVNDALESQLIDSIRMHKTLCGGVITIRWNTNITLCDTLNDTTLELPEQL